LPAWGSSTAVLPKQRRCRSPTQTPPKFKPWRITSWYARLAAGATTCTKACGSTRLKNLPWTRHGSRTSATATVKQPWAVWLPARNNWTLQTNPASWLNSPRTRIISGRRGFTQSNPTIRKYLTTACRRFISSTTCAAGMPRAWNLRIWHWTCRMHRYCKPVCITAAASS